MGKNLDLFFFVFFVFLYVFFIFCSRPFALLLDGEVFPFLYSRFSLKTIHLQTHMLNLSFLMGT